MEDHHLATINTLCMHGDFPSTDCHVLRLGHCTTTMRQGMVWHVNRLGKSQGAQSLKQQYDMQLPFQSGPSSCILAASNMNMWSALALCAT